MKIIEVLLVLLLLQGSPCALDAQSGDLGWAKKFTHTKAAGDTRKVFDRNAPEFLESYGQLFIETDEGSFKCTGNIVALEPIEGEPLALKNSIVTTSEHCIADKSIKDLYIVFTKRDGRQYRRQVEVLHLDKTNDFAILKMKQPIATTTIQPLLFSYEGGIEGVILSADMCDEETTTPIVAGYSADIFLGKSGQNLTYDQPCHKLDWKELGAQGLSNEPTPFDSGEYYSNSGEKINYWELCLQEAEKTELVLDCTAYPGASGGAVAMGSVDEDCEPHHYIIGVNKRVVADHGPGVVIVTDIESVYWKLRDTLEAHR